MGWTLGTAHWLRIPRMARRLLLLSQGELRLAARTHGTARALLAHNRTHRRVETLKPGHRGGWKHLNLCANRGNCHTHKGGDKLKPVCRPERKAVINSSLCAAPSGTHTVLNRSLSVLFVVAHAGRGDGGVSASVARSSASSSDSARSPTPARLSVPSARSAPVRLPPTAPLR